jgi:NAD-dependent histone deacetylase SIR2
MISLDLQSCNSEESAHNKIRLNEAIKYIFKSKRATVLTGAGISCNAGIPDFRSVDGLYNLVKKKFPNLKSIVKGQDLFDISLFRNEVSLAVFCTFMESLYNSTLAAKPTETHKFIKILKDRNKLLRCYTQNIDSLEKLTNLNVGINIHNFDSGTFNQNWKSLDVVQLHGNLHKLSCTSCFSGFDWTDEYQNLLSNGTNPECANCYAKYEERLYSGKRLTGNIGMLRPDIVLYGENHPQSEILAQGLNTDLRSKPDLLIIMGTSLKVDGVKKLVKSLAKSVHDKGGKVVFVNKTPLSKMWESYIDYEILCDCDEFVRIMKVQVPDMFLTQEQLDSKKLKNAFNDDLQDGIKQEKNKIKIKQEDSSLNNHSLKVELENESTSKIKIKAEPKIKSKTPKPQKSLVSQNSNSKTNQLKQESDNILTPPTTPTKRKRPSLQRKPVKKPKSDYDLPSPTASFSEDTTTQVKQEYKSNPFTTNDALPLQMLTKSQLNSIKIPKKSQNDTSCKQVATSN